MAEYSVSDKPGFAANGVVGNVVVPHHVERVGARFTVVGDSEHVGV